MRTLAKLCAWLAGLYSCRHDTTLRRRNDAGVMGWECAQCGRWWPVLGGERKLSRLASRLARQERALKARRRAREKDSPAAGPARVIAVTERKVANR